MVSQQMAMVENFFDQLRMGCRFLSNNKKSRFDPVLFEKGQQRFSGKGVGAVVKCEGYGFLT